MVKRFINIICFLAVLISAANVYAVDDSGRESLFILGAGCRALGMGGAFVAAAQDGSSVYYNPAGLGMLEYREVTFMRTSLYESTDYLYGSLAWPVLGFGAVGIGAVRLGTDDIVFRDYLGQLGNYDYSDGQYWVSYGIKVFDNLAVGANFKYLNKTLGDMSTSTGSFDLGLLAHYQNIVFIGANAQDLFSGKLKLGSKGEEKPYNVKGGIAVKYARKDFSVLAAADIDKTKKVAAKYHFGTEVGIKDLFFLRGGYDRTDITFGAGIRYKLAEIDYAFKGHSDLDATHRWGISFFFGPTISEQRENRLQKQMAEQERRNEKERLRQIEFINGKASGFYESEQWDSATVYYNQLLGYQPENVEAISRLRQIREKLAGQTRLEIDTRAGQLAYDQLLAKYNASADSLMRIGDLLNARLEYEKILELDSVNDNARNRLADIENRFSQRADSLKTVAERLIGQEHYAEAVVALTEAQKYKPDDTRINARITYAKTKLLIAQKLRDAIGVLNEGDTAAARQRFLEILELDPEEPVVTGYLVQLQAKPEITPVPIDQIKADNEYWLIYLDGLELFGASEYRQAIEKWEKVLEKYPGSEDTRENIRQARLRLKDINR